MEKLKVNELYEIEGKPYKLCKSKFEHSVNGVKMKKFYFRRPTYEDVKSTVPTGGKGE